MSMQIQALETAASIPAPADPRARAVRKLATPHIVKTTSMKPIGTAAPGTGNGIPCSIPILTISRIPGEETERDRSFENRVPVGALSPRDQDNRNGVNDQRTDWLEEIDTRCGLQEECGISRDSNDGHGEADCNECQQPKSESFATRTDFKILHIVPEC
jgi:hypothetical protein